MKIGQANPEKMFNDYEILYMYIAQGQGQITTGDKIFVVTRGVCYFDQTLFPIQMHYEIRKFDLAVKRSNVNLGSSFGQIWMIFSPQCSVTRFSLEIQSWF